MGAGGLAGRLAFHAVGAPNKHMRARSHRPSEAALDFQHWNIPPNRAARAQASQVEYDRVVARSRILTTRLTTRDTPDTAGTMLAVLQYP